MEDQENPEPSSSFIYEDSDSDTNECQPSQLSNYENCTYEPGPSVSGRSSVRNQGTSSSSSSSYVSECRISHSFWQGNEAEPGPSQSCGSVKRKNEDDFTEFICSSSSSSGQQGRVVARNWRSNEDSVSSPSTSFSLFGSPSTSGQPVIGYPHIDSDDSGTDNESQVSVPQAKRLKLDDAEALAVCISQPSKPGRSLPRFDSDACLVSSSTGAIDSPSGFDESFSSENFQLSASCNLASGVDSTSEGNLPDPESSQISDVGGESGLDIMEERSDAMNFFEACIEDEDIGQSNIFLTKKGQSKSLFQSQADNKPSSIMNEILAVAGPSGIKSESKKKKVKSIDSSVPFDTNIDHDSESSNGSDSHQVMHCISDFPVSFAQNNSGLKSFSSNKIISNFDQQYMMELNHLDDTELSVKKLNQVKDTDSLPVESNKTHPITTTECIKPAVSSKVLMELPNQLEEDQDVNHDAMKNLYEEKELFNEDPYNVWVNGGAVRVHDGLTNKHDFNVETQTSNEQSNEPFSTSFEYKENNQCDSLLVNLQPMTTQSSDVPRLPESIHDNKIETQRTADNNEHKYWCEECGEFLSKECDIHVVYAIVDKQVVTRPQASLPTQYLSLKDFGNDPHIVARRSIGKRILFGPLEGRFHEGIPHPGLYSVTSETGQQGYVDTTDDSLSNWMKYVRPADSILHMNCSVVEENHKIYFITTQNIEPKQELRVGFSKQYAEKYGLPQLVPTEEEQKEYENRCKTWQCFECESKFESSQLLQDHLSTHEQGASKRPKRKQKNGRKVHNGSINQESANNTNDAVVEWISYNCESCDLLFPTLELMEIHAQSHRNPSDEIRRKCPSCGLECDSNETIWTHIESHAQPNHDNMVNLFKCDLCYKSFDSNSKLQKHVTTHNKDADKQFECHLCLRRFCNKAALTSHLKFHAGESVQAYKCPICKESFSSVILLKSHIVIHKVNDKYTCPTCNKCFSIYSKIRRHIRAYHPETVQVCATCGKTFASVEKLRQHQLIHSDRRAFQCDLCPKSFKRKDKLKEHQKRLHSSPKKVTRKWVTKTVPQKDVEQFTFKCFICLLGFKRRGMLVNHLSKKHPEIPLDSVPELNQPILKECRLYYCHYCEKSYGTSMKRHLHIKKHHPGMDLVPSEVSDDPKKYNSVKVDPKKSYAVSCNMCPRQYASNAKLLQHQRKSHPKKTVAEDVPYSSLNRTLDTQIFALVTDTEPYCITLPTPLSQVDITDSGEEPTGESSANGWACLENLGSNSMWQ